MSPETVRKRRARETWAVIIGPEDGAAVMLRSLVSAVMIGRRQLRVVRRLRNGTMICREAD